MYFDFKLFLRLLYLSFCKSKGTNARLSLKRIVFLFVGFPSLFFMQCSNKIGFILDDLIWSDYRKLKVINPVFIVGAPRGGTTFLHRLLAKDKDNFSSMKLWEIMFAPSITQKKLLLILSKIDRLFGNPAYKLIKWIEDKLTGEVNKMHKISLFEAEEDDYLNVHICSSVVLIGLYPFEEELRPFIRFDLDLSQKDKKRIMAFYERCVRCHLYVFGRDKVYLSKNPMFSSKIRSINETFSDSMIICTVRTPYETIPSFLNLTSLLTKAALSPVEKYPLKDFLLELIFHWYRHPLNELPKMPENRHCILDYRDLIDDPKEMARFIYNRFGFEITSKFEEVLEQEKRRNYKSSHSYNLEQFELSKEFIYQELKSIFDQFGFKK